MTDDKKREALELAASMLQTGAHLAPAAGVPGLAPALEGVAAILRAAEVAMRDRGLSVEEIVERIHMPRKLDLDDFRRAIDERVYEKPEKA